MNLQRKNILYLKFILLTQLLYITQEHEFQKPTSVAQVDVTGIKGRLVKLNHIKIFHNSKIISHRV